MNFLRKTLYVIVGIILLAVLIELLLGLAFWWKDKGLEPMAVHDEPYLYYLFDQQNGTNEHGFKTDAPMDKPAGEFRIMLVGGSVARGRNPEQTISAYLEKELQQQFDSLDVEVINAGMSGYVVQQEFLLIQMLLQYYQPDMIVSLDGYNDLYTYKLNRFEPGRFKLPPHNWSHFQVVKEKRYENTFWSRITHLFKNMTRFYNYFQRAKRELSFSWQNVTDQQKQAVAETYINVANDTYFFCRSKRIDYLHFLQPVRFYDKKGQKHDEAALSDIYQRIEKQGKAFQFIYSLTQTLEGKEEVFVDDCHVTPLGNEVLAEEMARPITNWIKLRTL